MWLSMCPCKENTKRHNHLVCNTQERVGHVSNVSHMRAHILCEHKGKFYTDQVNIMPIGDRISLHTTTRNHMFKFPSFTCHKGSHGLKKTQSISALGISEDSSNDNTVHNGVLYSIPKVAICSLRYIWTNYRCSGKIFFVLYFSTRNIQGKAFCTLQHLPICKGTALSDWCWDGNLKKSITMTAWHTDKSMWCDRKPAITVC